MVMIGACRPSVKNALACIDNRLLLAASPPGAGDQPGIPTVGGP